ncbi:TetR/AcrR family transcriptional regulator C-terminal domain-containing protein [Phytomonospora endophytica]|uniref:TetR/AcrR family tetracycline transcriptional repressor n=1 Tax=Phytomonospora endophytica TaxID=714109 RepID=A0A841G6M1_9ACTN|nr:TetR/AcrR family transcriptional regulator C-terminal domain-containing protein [Phytomonospora endophytica]MBB6039720.1 TetR/AcrR family tetracycline transcriptional repressor [Phytomonospora endophytica]
MSEKPGLTRAGLIDAALTLLDEVGLKGLTVRRLAADLGVKSPALYWHIRTKQELLDGVAEAIVRAAGLGPPHDGEPWQDWLVRRALAYRAAVLGHRDGALVVASSTRLGAEALELFDAELRALVAEGFTPRLALDTISALSHYTTGFLLREQSPPTAGAGPVGALPGTLVAARRAGGGGFETGARLIVAGAERELAGVTGG